MRTGEEISKNLEALNSLLVGIRRQIETVEREYPRERMLLAKLEIGEQALRDLWHSELDLLD